MAASHGQMDAAVCARIVDKVAETCSTKSPQPPTAAEGPNLDALSASLASQGNALSAQANMVSLATLVIAVLALFGGIAWALYVRWRAGEIAKDTAKTVADNWLTENSASLVQQVAALISPSSTSLTPEEQARMLGDEEPK